jgi:hypothetical protein
MLNFSNALHELKDGARIRRAGWNGKGMWLGLITVGEWTFTNGKWDNYQCLPFIAMKTADDKIVPWLASQTDILADDWDIVEEH